MLIIQEIMLDWNKPERGGKFAEARNKFDYAFLIENKPDKSDGFYTTRGLLIGIPESIGMSRP